jgi:hypothetical protein
MPNGITYFESFSYAVEGAFFRSFFKANPESIL